MRERGIYGLSLHGRKQNNKNLKKYIMNTACSTIFKDKSFTADRAEICWLSDKDGEVYSSICITAACTKILRALGRVLVRIVINPK